MYVACHNGTQTLVSGDSHGPSHQLGLRYLDYETPGSWVYLPQRLLEPWAAESCDPKTSENGESGDRIARAGVFV